MEAFSQAAGSLHNSMHLLNIIRSIFCGLFTILYHFQRYFVFLSGPSVLHGISSFHFLFLPLLLLVYLLIQHSKLFLYVFVTFFLLQSLNTRFSCNVWFHSYFLYYLTSFPDIFLIVFFISISSTLLCVLFYESFVSSLSDQVFPY